MQARGALRSSAGSAEVRGPGRPQGECLASSSHGGGGVKLREKVMAEALAGVSSQKGAPGHWHLRERALCCKERRRGTCWSPQDQPCPPPLRCTPVAVGRGRLLAQDGRWPGTSALSHRAPPTRPALLTSAVLLVLVPRGNCSSASWGLGTARAPKSVSLSSNS